MTSTELKVGLGANGRTSNRVLKPPGGGHSNIFAEAEVSVNPPRPKYNQQNSTNLNACLGSVDANAAVEKLREEIHTTKINDCNGDHDSMTKQCPITNVTSSTDSTARAINENTVKGRVPPGGYSSGGFW